MSPDSLKRLLNEAMSLELIEQDQAAQILSLHAQGKLRKVDALDDSSGTNVNALLRLIGPALRDAIDSSPPISSAPSADPTVTHAGEPVSIEGLPAHFTIRRRLPGGGMGIVFEAFDEIHHRRVAIKISKADQHDAWLEKRLKLERQLVGALSHPGVVTLFGSGTLSNGHAYVVMEYIDGVTLTEYAATQQLDLTRRLRLFLHVAKAVAAVHHLRIVHRDLKPSNIIVRSDGRPKVLDFGLAKSLRRRKKQVTKPILGLSDAGFETLAGVGTRGYRSPEQRQGRRVTRRSDVYLLGVILHELLTGITPEEPPSSVLKSLPDSQQPTPLVWPAHIPADVRAVAAKCLAADPSNRYANAKQLATEIGRLLRHRPVKAVATGLALYRTRKFLRRNRLWVAMSALVFSLLALSNFAFFQSSRYQARLARVEHESARTNAERSEELESTVEESSVTTAVRLVAERRYDEALASLERVPNTRWGWECDRLALRIRHAPGPRRLLGLHQWMTTTGALSPDGTKLVTAGLDGQVLVHQSATDVTEVVASPAVALTQHEPAPDKDIKALLGEAIVAVGWQANPDAIIAARADGRLARWVIGTNEPQVSRIDGSIIAANALPDGQLWCVTDSNAIWQWDGFAAPQQRTLISGEPIAAITSVSADKCLFAQTDGALSVFDASNNQHRPLVKLRGKPVDIAMARNGRDAWIASRNDGITHVELSEDPQTAIVRETLRLPLACGASLPAIERVAASEDGNRVFAADATAGVACWDIDSGDAALYRKGTRDRALPAEYAPHLTAQLQNYVGLFVSSADGRRLFVGGQNATIAEWSFDPPDELHTIATPPGSRVAFDPTRPELLWIGQPDGRLNVRQLITDQEIHHTAGHATGIRFLVSARQGNAVVSADDQTIRRWRFDRDRIISLGEPLAVDAPTVALAIDSAGARMAVCSNAGLLTVYDCASGSELKSTQLTVERLAEDATFLIFNADGTRLAVATAPRHLWLLDIRDLTIKTEPAFFARDPTALVFHPTKAETLIGADALGRSIMWPEPRRQLHDRASFQGQPIAAVAVTPDGKRVAFASRAGHVVISDAAHELGPLLQLHEAATGVDSSPVRSLHFDTRGERLAMHRESGAVHLWDNSDGATPVAELPNELWHVDSIAYGPAMAGLHVRDASVALDSGGRMGILFQTRPTKAGSIGPARVSLARQSPHGWQFQDAYQSPPLDNRAAHSLERSLGLTKTSSAWHAYLRRPHSPDLNSTGELVRFALNCEPQRSWRSTTQFERPPSQSLERSADIVAGPGNLGFDTFVGQATGTRESTALLHYSHHRRELVRTVRDGNGWPSNVIGRPGDGFDMAAAQDRDGRCHIAFAPVRYDGDPQPPVYMRLGADGRSLEAREYFDDAIDAYPASIGLDAENRPVVVAHERFRALSRTFVARRDTTGWRRIATLPVALAKSGYTSRPLFDPAGAIQLAALHLPSGKLRLFTHREFQWTCRVIGNLPERDWRTDHAATPYRISQPALRQAPDGRLLVVVAIDDGDASSLRLLRQHNP